MDAFTYLINATNQLEDAGIGTARLDVLVLMEDCLRINRAHLLAHPERKLTAEQIKKLNEQIAQRSEHQPLAYIRGVTEFYGRNFSINHDVLEPRPESETMIELLKQLALPSKPVIGDVGTGSGALAITAKLEMPNATVIASDIDPACLKVAERNAKHLKAEITAVKGDLAEQILKQKPDVLLCNLPYVPNSFRINPAAMQEPKHAIFGGSDGLDLYRRLFAQLAKTKRKPQFVLTEALPPQHDELASIALAQNYDLQMVDDFIQVFCPLS